MARLDRLNTAKEIAQLGAVLGREFSYELLHAVSRWDEGKLQNGLRQLVETELVYQRGAPPQATYVFKHALVQDAAYQSLLKSKRQQYHQQIAQVLDTRFLKVRESQPELLAYHYAEAGLIAQAIPYWQQAGQRATQRSANVEAIAHLAKGLEAIKSLPDTVERAQQELQLQIALSAPLMATKGYASPEREAVFTRAYELCQQIGEISQLFLSLAGLRSFYSVWGKLQMAREVGDQLLRLAHKVQDPNLLLQAHYALGMPSFLMGEFTSARAHLEQALALYGSQQHQAYTSQFGLDIGVGCRSALACILWFLGYPDQTLKCHQDGRKLAQELSHPHSLALALMYPPIHMLRREGRATQALRKALHLLVSMGFRRG
jgi:predicted ATPase